MRNKEFLERCVKLGLTREEAIQQLQRARLAGHTEGDPYIVAWILQGLSVKTQLLFEATLDRFEADRGQYARSIANDVAQTSAPKLEEAVHKALDRALTSPTRIAARALHILMLICLTAGTSLFWGHSVSEDNNAFWSEVSSRPNASEWQTFITNNGEAPGWQQACRASRDLQRTNTEGVYCTLKFYVDRTGDEPPKGHQFTRYILWLQITAGFAAGVLSVLIALRLKPICQSAWKRLVHITRGVAP